MATKTTDEAAPTKEIAAASDHSLKEIANIDGLIAFVVKEGGESGIANLERLMDLREREQKRIAEAEFNAAMQGFQSDCPVIPHDKQMASKGRKVYSYASIEQIYSVVRPIMHKWGLTDTFETTESEAGTMSGTCRITHRLGHFREFHMSMPMVVSPKGPSGYAVMGAAQCVMSTRSYLRRGLLTNALGLSSSESDIDAAHDRGDEPQQEDTPNQHLKPAEKQPMTEDDLAVIQTVLVNKGIGEDALVKAIQEQTKGKFGDLASLPKTALPNVLRLIDKLAEASK